MRDIDGSGSGFIADDVELAVHVQEVLFDAAAGELLGPGLLEVFVAPVRVLLVGAGGAVVPDGDVAPFEDADGGLPEGGDYAVAEEGRGGGVGRCVVGAVGVEGEEAEAGGHEGGQRTAGVVEGEGDRPDSSRPTGDPDETERMKKRRLCCGGW